MFAKLSLSLNFHLLARLESFKIFQILQPNPSPCAHRRRRMHHSAPQTPSRFENIFGRGSDFSRIFFLREKLKYYFS